MKDRHIVYTLDQYTHTDADGVDHYEEGRPVYCGDYERSTMVLCDKHQAEAEERYPQRWAYYPGDTCVHGVYVGGSGPDLICQDCENGDMYWHDCPTYALCVSVLGGATSVVTQVNPWAVGTDHDIEVGLARIERFMQGIAADLADTDRENPWTFKGVPVFTFHAVLASPGYWHDVPQERIQLDA